MQFLSICDKSLDNVAFHSRMCLMPKCTSPRAFNAALAYIMRLRTKIISDGALPMFSRGLGCVSTGGISILDSGIPLLKYKWMIPYWLWSEAYH
jgi:hypothetical protein